MARSLLPLLRRADPDILRTISDECGRGGAIGPAGPAAAARDGRDFRTMPQRCRESRRSRASVRFMRGREFPLCWLAMRIIAGTFRSRGLAAPRGLSTRPTSDRLRETLFNVLAGRIEGTAFLDLYAGSGAVGMEALSRGAAFVTFVERAPAALKVLHGNLARLGIEGGFRIHAGSVGGVLRATTESGRKPERYGVVYLDPPYAEADEYAVSLGLLGGAARELLAEGAVVVAEHGRKQALAERYGSLGRTRLLEQGDAALSFYAVKTDAA